MKYFLGLLLLCSIDSFALSKKDKILLRKNFYLLYLLEEQHVQLKTQPFMTMLQRLENDAREAGGYGKTLQFTDAEIEAGGNELARLSISDSTISQLVRAVKVSGAYQLFASEVDTIFIRKVWQADARGVNYMLATYIEGRAPLYSKIDAISFAKDDPGFHQKISNSVHNILVSRANTFYSIPMLLALEALRLNERDEAARYEPLTSQQNAPAYRAIKKISWEAWPYSVILVPGLGPEQPGVKLDPNGAKRCDSAAVRYRAGKAPFLVVSGGHVHPNKTPYCEAVEMKKYMVRVLRIPAEAIIIEPHARHTTTNIRNANRLIYRFKIPANKPVLIVTDASQNAYITGNMRDKVMKELGYVPFTSIKKLSSTETEYMPSENSLHINSLDPLDP